MLPGYDLEFFLSRRLLPSIGVLVAFPIARMRTGGAKEPNRLPCLCDCYVIYIYIPIIYIYYVSYIYIYVCYIYIYTYVIM